MPRKRQGNGIYRALNRTTLKLERLEYPSCHEAAIALQDNPLYAVWTHEGNLRNRFKRLGPYRMTLPLDFNVDGEIEVYLTDDGQIDCRLVDRRATRLAQEASPQKVMALIPMAPIAQDVNRQARRDIVITMQHLAMLYRTAVLGELTDEQQDQIKEMMHGAHELHGSYCQTLFDRKVTLTKIAETADCTRQRITQRIEFAHRRVQLRHEREGRRQRAAKLLAEEEAATRQ